MENVTLLVALAAPFVWLFVVAFLSRHTKTRTGWLAALGLVPAFVVALVTPEGTSFSLPWIPQLGLNLELALDGFSRLFFGLIAFMGIVTCCYGASYLYDYEKHGRFYSYLLLFAGSMLGLSISNNLVLLFLFWEMTSVSSFLLIGFWHTRAAARDGAMKALLITGMGGLALLAATALIALGGGSANLAELNIEAFRSSPYFTPALLLVLLAAFTKSAQFPFHFWLPTAMEAPTPVSAYLHSATMVKAGLFLVAKLGFLFQGSLWTTLTLGFGLATLLWGAFSALRQTDLKALLAYSTISQLGLILSLYGLNTSLGNFAATVHLVNHAAFKATLFFVTGLIDHATGTRDVRLLSGLRRVMPVSFVLAVVAALAMAGVPPLGGFISKELFFETMLELGTVPITLAVIGSIFTFAYSFKFLSVFFGKLNAPEPEKLHEASPQLWGTVMPLAVAAVVFGVLPTTAETLARVAETRLGFETLDKHLTLWHGLTLALGLSALTWLVGSLIFTQRARFQNIKTPWTANTLYYATLSGLEKLAVTFNQWIQVRPLPMHLRVMLWTIVVVVGYGLLRSSFALPILETIPLDFVPIALLLVAGAGGVLLARDAISAIIFTGLTGFGTAATFLVMRAPDLALTQLLIEAVTVILLLLALRFLPPLRARPRSPMFRVADFILALSVGVGVFAFLMASSSPLQERISTYYLENSYAEAGGRNVVNVILVDFRGYDTLGEIVVLAIVAVGVRALVKLRRKT
jgi:NADH:ubiquinone oxidoreductase subunit 5 (subunit L)/multisubunit Na+/H+ antiporter MnhA subunit/multisubunit Na+/H+ antiporter MnhB subunit